MNYRDTSQPSKSRIGSWIGNFFIFLVSAAVVLVILRWRNNRQQARVVTNEPLPVVRVQVLNGCGVSGMAGKLRDHLMRYQVDVRETGNTRIKLPETVVMDRVADRHKAESVARLIGVDPGHVIQQINKSLIDIDVTIIIGKDYRACFDGIMPVE